MTSSILTFTIPFDRVQVICTLGSVVFVSILLIRGIWSGVSHVQENHGHIGNEHGDDHQAWTGTRPAT